MAIPHRNVVSDLPEWLRGIPGLRPESDSVRFVIPTAELVADKAALPVLEDVHGVLTIFESAAAADMVIRSYQPMMQEIWSSTGRFSGSRVEEVPNASVVRLFDRWSLKSRAHWYVLRNAPTPDAPFPENVDEFWYGDCQNMVRANDEQPTCLSLILADRFLATVYLDEANVLAFPAVRSLLKQKIKSWRDL